MEITINGWTFYITNTENQRRILNGAADMNCSSTRRDNGFTSHVTVEIKG